MKSRHKVRLTVVFDRPLSFDKPFTFKHAFSQCDPDNVKINNDSVVIEYYRSGGLLKARALNKKRVKFLQLTALYLSCLEDASSYVVSYRSAFISIDDNHNESVEIPDSLLNLQLDFAGCKFPRSVIENALDGNDLSNTLSIAISYCWAASMSSFQEERLKLLWGSFNALYRFYFREIKCSKGGQGRINVTDAAMLDTLNDLFLQENIFNRSIVTYDNEIKSEYKAFVRWKVLTGDKSRSIYMRNSKDKHKLSRLYQMDMETLCYMRDYGCGCVQGKSFLKSQIEDVISNGLIFDDQTRKIAMLLCRYIYIFRCSSVHAETEYPIFNKEKENEKRKMANLLESAIVDFATFLSLRY